jgi:hypothetical protein
MLEHRACLCPRCTDRPAPTYTEKHRHACEVDDVLAMPDKGARKAYLAAVARHRGPAHAERLKEAVVQAWRDGRA